MDSMGSSADLWPSPTASPSRPFHPKDRLATAYLIFKAEGTIKPQQEVFTVNPVFDSKASKACYAVFDSKDHIDSN